MWGLALGLPAASAQQASGDKGPCAQGQAGDQPSTAGKSGSDCQADDKSKDTTPPAYKLLRYEEDYSYLKDPSRRTDFWDPIKYIPLGGRSSFWGMGWLLGGCV
jgi:hypothetical protein